MMVKMMLFSHMARTRKWSYSTRQLSNVLVRYLKGHCPVTTSDATAGGLFIQSSVGQTANLFAVQDSDGNGLMTLDSSAVSSAASKAMFMLVWVRPDYAENIPTSQ